MRRKLMPVLLAAGGLVPGQAAAQVGTPSPHGAGLQVPCTACHTTDAWSPARRPMDFSHASTGFPLTAAHAGVACAGCHLGLRFDEPGPSRCGDCHVDVHQGRLSTDCESCHQAESWRGERERIRAHLGTSFLLTGSHLRVDCDACHLEEREGAYTGLDPACRSCHLDVYRQTTFPDHVASGYSQECQNCHGATTWRGGRFDHSDAGFLLIGAHNGAPCALCHQGPNREVPWSPTDENDCVACHRVDYDRAHGGQGYPLECTVCHTPTNWEGLSFDHEQIFPIQSGAHRGRWETCQDCHPTLQDFSQFTCITCHTRSDTDPRHNEVGGYVYESTACLSCHPRGRGESD
jgi:hypothetical protein